MEIADSGLTILGRVGCVCVCGGGGGGVVCVLGEKGGQLG